ncbi:4a-hydroxytetrahydrobiopterin dehydratase [Candidatus Nomurabacteria bacterium]|nr:4a-hydroxytetrahydrobiopterin dehydratase [Candidatus Nomurabacteria bacterium]MCB9820499.1 4a-hydroxytetrahydrobiopterin dehydratase [Candidatus Nomurabacteria bacterium]
MLKDKKCIPCEDENAKAIDPLLLDEYLQEINDWEISDDKKSISKKYVFRDFVKSLEFANAVGDIAEIEGHHPDINISYNKVKLTLTTHNIGDLTENDFILAAKINALDNIFI